MLYLKKALLSDKGSALIGVVAFSVILSIAAVTYATLARNSVTNETLAYNNARAYYAAEAGLQLAASWIGDEKNWAYLVDNDDYISSTDIPGLSIDPDFNVTVRLSWTKQTKGDNPRYDGDLPDEDDGTVIAATVESHLLTYTKTLESKVTREVFAALFNEMSSGAFPSGDMMGLSQRTAIFGPLHLNSPIMVSQNAFDVRWNGVVDRNRGARIYGPVSVWGDWYEKPCNANITDENKNPRVPWYESCPNRSVSEYNQSSDLWHGFGISPNGKDFSKGVMVSKASHSDTDPKITGVTHANKGTKFGPPLDNVFRGSFNPNAVMQEVRFEQPKVQQGVLHVHEVYLTTGTTNYVDKPGNWNSESRIITVHQQTINTSNAISDPRTVVIRFGRAADASTTTQRAFYEFSQNNGTFIHTTGKYDTKGTNTLDTRRVYYNEDVPTIIKVGADEDNIGVLVQGGSELSGQVTLVTGKGDISFRLFQDYNGGLLTTPETNTSSIKDGHIMYKGIDRVVGASGTLGVPKRFNVAATVPNDAGFQSLLSWEGQTSKDGEEAAKTSGIDLTAANPSARFAFYSGGNINLYLFGPNQDIGTSDRERIITAQLFAMNKDKSIRIPRGRPLTFAHVVGTTAGDVWSNTAPTTTTTGTSPGPSALRIYLDKRNIGKSPYGPGISITGAEVPRKYTKWREINTPKS